LIDRLSDAVVVGRPEVAVDLEGGRRLVVSERHLDGLDGAAGGDESAREVVAEVVEADASEPG
jgi:hypothetical protein